MKKPNLRLLLSILMLLSIVFVSKYIGSHPTESSLYQTTPSQESKNDKQALMDKHGMPNEHFYLQRAYPDFDMPVTVLKNALYQAREQARTSSSAAKQEGISGIDADWTIEGPTNIGGRINVIAVNPTDANIIYVGGPRGGIYKTIDGGATWSPIFDEPLFTSIGDIVLAPNDPNTIYVGTGDVNISSHFSVGDGIYRSTDAGATWQNIGLSEVGIISKIIIDPTNPNRIFVSAMGNPLLRNEHRGVYRSINGGTSWQKILYVDDDAGVIDLVMSHSQPNTIYAASWNRIRNLQETITYEEDSKIWKTTNGGESWSQLTTGLPNNYRSRIGLSMSSQNADRLAAVYVDSTEALLGVYISDNGGESWEQTATADSFGGDPLGGFGWYFGKIYFHSQDDQRLFVLGVDMYQSFDGGYTWDSATPPWWLYSVHADKHALVFDKDGNIILGTDGGVYRSSDDGEEWQDIEYIPNTQFYRVAVNPHQDNMYCGGAQDNGTTMGNADMINEWPRIFGGDGFTPVFHPTNPDVLYIEMQWGSINYTEDGGANFNSGNEGIDPIDRRNWDMPYMISHHQGNQMYAGTYRMYRSDSSIPPLYEPISDDLTDGIIYGERFHTISTIDQSNLVADYLYAGTSDGNVWRSLNDGVSWNNVTGSLPDRYVTCVKASPHIPNAVYLSISGYKGNGVLPHVFKSINNGTDWTVINGDLPAIAVNDILVLPEDESDQILFAATDAGVYMTGNGGTNWQRLGGNMPIFSIFDIDYDPRNHKLVAATFARSIMSFDLNEVIDFSGTEPVVGIKNLATAATSAATLRASYESAISTIHLFFSNPIDQDALESATVSLFSLNGTCLTKGNWANTTAPYSLLIANLPSGMYLVVAEKNGERYAQKVGIAQ